MVPFLPILTPPIMMKEEAILIDSPVKEEINNNVLSVSHLMKKADLTTWGQGKEEEGFFGG
ncbi:hypothetical protein N780_03110 [Pontibacillus chungwhensis BH030062]|uniref:Uncharacterized protein n=1 Tax=Pontibacillus chungwhensis BH030062 TaxID=1385513 RepID=A0A0A2UVN0_9BACI|nr:hypothetical protein N780_03110 [Pontibacillus chungwhensis BH030062]